MSSSNCCILTCIQVSQEASQVVWYPSFFRIFHSLLLIHTIKGFDVVNKAEIDASLELFCFFDAPADVGNLISGSSAFSKTSLNICKFMVHILLRAGLENFEHYFTSMWDECNCAVVYLNVGNSCRDSSFHLTSGIVIICYYTHGSHFEICPGVEWNGDGGEIFLISF